jgi:hypothetical protein
MSGFSLGGKCLILDSGLYVVLKIKTKQKILTHPFVSVLSNQNYFFHNGTLYFHKLNMLLNKN